MQRLVIAMLLVGCGKDNRDERVAELTAKLEIAQRDNDQLRKTISEMDHGIKLVAPDRVVDASALVIQVGPQTIEVSDKPLSLHELGNLFRAAYIRDHNTHVVIKQDPATMHGRIVTVMEAAKTAGLTHLSIVTP